MEESNEIRKAAQPTELIKLVRIVNHPSPLFHFRFVSYRSEIWLHVILLIWCTICYNEGE